MSKVGSSQAKKAKMTKEAKQLAEENHSLIYSFLRTYQLPEEEYYGLAAIGLCEAAMSFREGRSCFSTYAYRCMSTEVMHECAKQRRKKIIPEHLIFHYQSEIEGHDGKTAPFLEHMPVSGNTEDEAVAKVLFNDYMEMLNERDRKILLLSREGYSCRDIEKILGCSKSQVSIVKQKLRAFMCV